MGIFALLFVLWGVAVLPSGGDKQLYSWWGWIFLDLFLCGVVYAVVVATAGAGLTGVNDPSKSSGSQAVPEVRGTGEDP